MTVQSTSKTADSASRMFPKGIRSLIRRESVAADGDSMSSMTGSISEHLISKREGKNKWMRRVAFVSAMISCLSAGSFLLFSLYAPIFQKRLHYNQMQINAVAIGGELGMYLPVPLFGYFCDRYGPARLSLVSTLFFTPGYLIASYAYANKMTYGVMVSAFLLIGAGTSSMYLSGVSTCAKNFTKRRGLALALPIAAFGLSSFWLSQIANSFFYERDGGIGDSGGTEIDVKRLFIFFAFLLLGVGGLGMFGLRILPEDNEEIFSNERVPLLAPAAAASNDDDSSGTLAYGATDNIERTSSGSSSPKPTPETVDNRHINAETRAFLKDPTMWLFAMGFFLITGPGEAFLANMGSLIHSVNSTKSDMSGGVSAEQYESNPATHVSIIAITSTFARVASGLVSDYFAPPNEEARDTDETESEDDNKSFHISRVTLIIFFALFMPIAHLSLATGLIQQFPYLFWIVSGSIGIAYGAVFSLAPNVTISIWGHNNFSTFWGIITMMPALGATFYGILFARVYDAEATRQKSTDGTCYGVGCYNTTFWVMAGSVFIACLLWLFAWKGRNGWKQRGIVV